MLSDILLIAVTAVGWIGLLIFFLLWLKQKNLREERKYNPEIVFEIRKELRTVNDTLKNKIEDIRREIYNIFVTIDKVLERVQ